MDNTQSAPDLAKDRTITIHLSHEDRELLYSYCYTIRKTIKDAISDLVKEAADKYGRGNLLPAPGDYPSKGSGRKK